MIEICIYWISTTLLSLLYLASATLYLVKREWVRQALADLGYPANLMPLLIAVKILAVVVILLPLNVPLSDLAYAGMLYHLLLSAFAHLNVRKPSGALPAAICLALLITSFVTQNAARVVHSPYVQAPAETLVTPE